MSRFEKWIESLSDEERQRFHDHVWLTFIKGLARVGWWLQKPLIIEQRKAMTTVNMFTDVDDDEIESFIDSVRERTDSQVSHDDTKAGLTWFQQQRADCKHERHTEPKYGGGNYGHYGTIRCLDCGAWKDDYSDWHVSTGDMSSGGPDFISNEPRTLDVSTEEIRSWPTIRPSHWTPEQAAHVHGLVSGVKPEFLKPDVREALEQAEAVRVFKERLEQAEPMIDTLTRDELEAAWPHLRDERLEGERQRWLERWEVRRQRRLEQDSTVPPEAPQSPVDRSGWSSCQNCSKLVDPHSEGILWSNVTEGGVRVGTRTWCNDDCYDEWANANPEEI